MADPYLGGIPPQNTVNVGGKGSDKYLKARVYDLTRKEWIIVERVDAREMIRVGSHSWTEPNPE